MGSFQDLVFGALIVTVLLILHTMALASAQLRPRHGAEHETVGHPVHQRMSVFAVIEEQSGLLAYLWVHHKTQSGVFGHDELTVLRSMSRSSFLRDSATSSKVELQSPISVCRNKRTVGYHGVSDRY